MKIYLGKFSIKKFLRNKLVKLIYKFVKLVTKTDNKILKLKIYNKVINYLIYENKWYKAIDQEL